MQTRGKNESEKRAYLIRLNSRRSYRALIAALLIALSTFFAVLDNVIISLHDEPALHYFTNLAQLLSATGALFMIPYAVEGIRKKRFTMPRWIRLFQYAGAVSSLIIMICASTIIAVTLGPAFAFRGPQLWLHLVIPVLVIILFLAVESGTYLSKKDSVFAQIPFWIYIAIYYVMVVLIGEENGGWIDIYQVKSRLPLWLVALMLFAIGYGAAILLRVLQNKHVSSSLRKLTNGWTAEMSPVEMKIEAFGLGRFMAKHQDQSEVIIPLDLLQMMAEKNEVSLEELTRAYMKGVTDSLSEL